MSETGETSEPRAKGDPAALALRARPQPITRLNRRTIAALIGGVVIAVVLAATWGLQPKARRSTVPEPVAPKTERVPRAEGLEALPRDYASVPHAPTLGPPLGELGRARLSKEESPPEYSMRSSAIHDAVEQSEATKIARIQAEVEAAAKAPVFFQLSRRQRPTTSTENQEAVDDVGERTRATNAAPGIGQASDGMALQNGQLRKQAFLESKPDPSIHGSGMLQRQISPYELLAGTVIPAALVTGINSDLPGQMIAAVIENVFDSVTGRHLLIPQGSKLLGEYDSQIAFGQRRVLMVWTRLILPDGASIILDRLPGVDTAGNTGLEDGVDWHWRRLLAGAALSTLVGVGAELAAPDRNDTNGRVVVASRESVQESVNEVGQQITRRNLNVQPTLRVRPGFRFRVIVNRDLILPLYDSPSERRPP
jgi:type IV secretion system protein TrbI